VTPASQQQRDEDACWQQAARLRAEHRGWVVIWLAAGNCFKAYPAPRGALMYSRHSREEFGRRFLGLMAYLASKD
jgi:hypothetical protein